MEFNFTKRVSANKRLWAVLIIFCALLLLMRIMSAPSVAQSEERVLEDLIPKHLPIKVKIKKEKEQGFKKIDNERWLRDFELEVTNTGDKPIYYLRFYLKMPEIKAATGINLLFPLDYGRRELSDIQTKAGPDDVPIKPGETYVFKIHPGQVPAWERAVREEKRPQPKIIQVVFQKLSYGDATGFVGSGGQALPHKQNKQSSMGRCPDQPNKAGPKTPQWQLPTRGSQHRTSSMIDLPATLLPVNFLSSKFFEKVSFKTAPMPQDCCPGVDCDHLTSQDEFVCYNCPNQTRIQPKDR